MADNSNENKVKDAADLAKEMIAKAEEVARALISESQAKDEERHQARMEESQKNIVLTIEKTVNGKVLDLKNTVETYIQADIKWKEEDKIWKSKVNPVTKLYEDTTFLGSLVGKGFVKITKFIILVGATIGAWLVIAKFFFK